MAKYPKTPRSFRACFPDDGACRSYLERLRWPKGPRCPKCPRAKVWAKKPPVYRCSRCGYDFTVTAGTLFADTRQPLRLWFEVIWYVAHQKKGTSARELQRIVQMANYQTAWRWLHKLRRVMAPSRPRKLNGTVEVDDITLGTRASGQSLVLMVVKISAGLGTRLHLARIANASETVLTAAVQHCVEPGTRVLTDNWRGYRGLRSNGYTHEVVPRTPSKGQGALPRIKKIEGTLRHWLGDTHGGSVAPWHLDYYLDEFTFRFNRSDSTSPRGMIFYQMLRRALRMKPVRSDDLIGGTENPANSRIQDAADFGSATDRSR